MFIAYFHYVCDYLPSGVNKDINQTKIVSKFIKTHAMIKRNTTYLDNIVRLKLEEPTCTSKMTKSDLPINHVQYYYKISISYRKIQ